MCSGPLNVGDVVIVGGSESSENQRKLGLVVRNATAVDGQRVWPIRLNQTGNGMMIKETNLMNAVAKFQ